jgi:Spy/CpxP family protein refolding chaperone
MRKVLATIAVAALAIGFSAAAFAADPDQKSPSVTVAPEGDSSVPEATEAGGNGEESASEEQGGADADLKKRFTRHRPGACPEGPPCKVD